MKNRDDNNSDDSTRNGPENSSNSNDMTRRLPPVAWHDPPHECVDSFSNKQGSVNLRFGRISEGSACGMSIVEIDTGPMQIVLLPDRGMSIWQVVCDHIPFQWNSPVRGPVLPALVPVHDGSGIGWLVGFDEFIVRCGLVSNGAPEFDDGGNVIYPLHGRIANLPASRIWCEQDSESLAVVGNVFETRLFFNQLQLESRLKVQPGARQFEIVDRVTNLASTPTTTQMLYHINVGVPLLAEGAELLAPVIELAPRDSHAAEDIGHWSAYSGPENGYRERVYFAKLAADSTGHTSVLLHNPQDRDQSPDSATGLGVRFATSTLPNFVLWKNTASEQDGYVTGLEPATNFPNQRSFEERQGRVVRIEPGQCKTYQITVDPLVGAQRVANYATDIELLQQAVTPIFHNQPKSGWSPEVE